MNGYYNRPLTLTDFLYLSVFIIGISQFDKLEIPLIYFPYFVISLSILLDWNSAITITDGGIKLLTSDLLTVINYLLLYLSCKNVRLYSPNSFNMFFLHYSIIFLIYLIWNLIIIQGKTENDTKKFFRIYNVIAFIIFLYCIILVVYINCFKTTNIKNIICNTSLIVISFCHLIVLITWFVKTYFNRSKT